MIKIAMCVRNRLGITKKAIEALHKHTNGKFQLYIYDNISTYRVKEHFQYFWKLYEQGAITQVVFNTKNSTHNAFSKCSSTNEFGLNHEQDPKKDNYEFLTMIDNDMIVTPGWDDEIRKLWDSVESYKLDHVFVVGQHPGGTKHRFGGPYKSGDTPFHVGKLGGSGFWNVRPNFFRQVGYIDLQQVVGLHKKHDQTYWRLLNKASGGKGYIASLEKKLVFHLGGMVGSVCNNLTKTNIPEQKKLKIIEFKESDEKIENMDFDEFYNMVKANKGYHRW